MAGVPPLPPPPPPPPPLLVLAPERLRLEGLCTERGFLVLLHQGPRELQWELFLGSNRIDWKLIEIGGFTVETKQDLVSVEIPLFSPG